jgi:hypothetical protein
MTTYLSSELDGADDHDITVTDLIELERYEEAAALLVEGDEISRNILDNDESEMLAAYLPTTLRLERVGLCWLVATECPAQDERAVA